MKLIIQIPCYNEAENIPQVIAEIPRDIPGVDSVEILIIDDGSIDDTAEIAITAGADHIHRNKKNLGLARSFQIGLDTCLDLGADIIVNTDGDNQYSGSSIPSLIQPILDHKADIVVGDRRPGENPDFSPIKRLLQRLGTGVLRGMTGLEITDAVSGFRAYSRDAALSTHVFTNFTYTTETLINAANRNIHVVSVPVVTKRVTRPSRLFSSIPAFVSKHAITIVRSYIMYKPLRAFLLVGLVMISIGLIPILRFSYFFIVGEGDGHIQSLVLGSMLFMFGGITSVLAFLGDTISTNRQLLEKTLESVHKLELRLQNNNEE